MSSVPPTQRPDPAYGGAPPLADWQDPAPPAAAPAPPPAAPAAPAGWAQPARPHRGYAEAPAGYADPGYRDPAYQPTAAWPGGAAAGYRAPRAPRARRGGPSLVTVAPALFASVAVSAGVLVLLLGNLFVALGAPAGTPGRDRLLQFLSPADLAAAAAVVLAVALVVLQRKLPGEVAPIGPRGGRVRTIALLAGGVAALVALAALVRGFVFLTVPHTPGAVKTGDFIAHLAVVLVAGSAAAWGLRDRW